MSCYGDVIKTLIVIATITKNSCNISHILQIAFPGNSSPNTRIIFNIIIKSIFVLYYLQFD